MDVRIAWTCRSDMDDILAIEAASFPYPWSLADFEWVLRQGKTVGMTATCNDEIAGYVVYGLHKNRLELVNLAIAADYRRKGVATAIIDRMRSKLAPGRREQLCANVWEYNLPAQQFFRAVGFRAVDVIRNAYDNSDNWSAYRFLYQLGVTADSPNNRLYSGQVS